MVSARLLRSIITTSVLFADALESFVNPADADLAFLEDLLGPVLELFGFLEPVVFWLGGILGDLLERMRFVDSQRFRPSFIRPELNWPGNSAALYTLQQRRDAGYMLLVRVDVATFDWIMHVVSQTSPHWFNRRNTDKRYNLNAALCIAATLAWAGSSCTQRWLQQTFGNTRSVMSRDLRQGRRVLLRALRTCREARIEWPTPPAMSWFFDLICQARDALPPLPGCKVFGWIDGFRSRVLQPGIAAEQARNYNGWVGDTSVLSLFGFLPTGKIFYASLNYPGRAHDKTVSADFMAKLLNPLWTPRDFGVMADAAFVSPRLLFKVWTRKRSANWPIGFCTAEQWESFVGWLTGSRQAVEWGMRALRARWARLNAPMPNNNEERADLLELVVLLHNVVTERIGANQIRNVFLEAALRHSAGNADVEDVAADFY